MREAFSILIILAALTATSHAEIDVREQYEPHQPIVATVDASIPDGARIKGGWSCETAELRSCGDPNEVHVWAAPGEHVLIYSGVWVQSRDVTIDGETFPVLVDFGQVDDRAKFQVGRSDPPPPPPPPGDRWGIIVEETTERTAEQAELWLDLRQRLELNELLIIDQDSQSQSVRKYVQAAREANQPLPVLVVVSEDSGEVVEAIQAPDTVDGVLEELGRD